MENISQVSQSTEVRKKGELRRAARVLERLRSTFPVGRDALRDYVRVFMNVTVPDVSLCEGHASPMDYLSYAFHMDTLRRRSNGDAVVWANRGGGKTEIAAVLTLLDCLFKPGCQVRILGGSGEQSQRMYQYLQQFLRMGFERFLDGPLLKNRCRFVNGSSVEVLTQSHTSVRGQHIHKLRCDELELFSADVFDAAKFTTQSSEEIVAAMETISTMHRPYGLMQRVVEDAKVHSVPVFRWCVWETAERCMDRECSQCALYGDCRGRAKRARGYFRIDDILTIMRRSSRAGFESEMLCKRPSREHVVFDEFDEDVHVKPIAFNEHLPIYRAIDFGFVNPFVCLWLQVDEDGVVRVVDEYVRSRATIDVHAQEIQSRTPSGETRVAATYCDPAGASKNDVTGTSAVRELRAMGVRVRFRRSGILEGIELIRRAIRSGDGSRKLIVGSRCKHLIEALRCYHYPDDTSGERAELPVKDGVYDHAVDALRYFFINHSSRGTTRSRRY